MNYKYRIQAKCTTCDLATEFQFGADGMEWAARSAFWVPAWHGSSKNIIALNLCQPYEAGDYEILAEKLGYIDSVREMTHFSFSDYYIKKQGAACPNCKEHTLGYKKLIRYEDIWG